MRRELCVCVTAAAAVGVGVERAAEAEFVGFVVTSSLASHAGEQLVVHTLWARFNGPTDTVLNAFNFASTSGGAALVGFWHKDNSYYNSGVLMQEFGTWNPSQTGSATNNRPFDSYVTKGGLPTAVNTTNADPSWTSGGNADFRSWNRPDLPNNGTLGWFDSVGSNLQGRVGVAGNTATDVRLGQFVLSASDATLRTFSLTIGYNDGVAGSAVQFGSGQFELCFLKTLYRDLDNDGIGAAGDGVLQSCVMPAGYAELNGDNCPSIPNPNQADCNSNGIGDVCDIASALSLDCDGDSVPDECEGASIVSLASPLMPFGGAQFARHAFTAIPAAYGRQPVLTIEVRADLGGATDGVLVSLDGGAPTTLFVNDGTDCPVGADIAMITLPIADFNALAADGTLTVRVTPFGAVSSASCTEGGVRVKLDYAGLPAASDCNANGQLDSCEIGTGAQPDCNGNLVPDSCELAAGSATDCNGNARLDSCDLALGSSTDLNGNGVLDDCAGEFIVGGSGFATIQAAVQAAPVGATVLVGVGVHAPVDLSGKAVTIQSLAGAAQTVIDGGATQRCVTMSTPAAGATVVRGFTLRNGRAVDGGAVRVIGSSLSLRDSVVRGNVALGSGGGVAVTNGSVVIANCVIEENSADRGGGLFVERAGAPGSAVVRDSVVARNASMQPGGGIHNRGQVTLERVAVSENVAGSGAGGLWSNQAAGVVAMLLDALFCVNAPVNIEGPYEEDPDAPASRFGQDCDGNGVCDALETLPDCNANGSPDACDIAAGVALDCNENGVPDSCDIASGSSTDVDSNGIPDDCKPDCDDDGLPDAWELAQGLDADCNANATIDRCEIAQAPGLDCDGDLQLDACEIAEAPALDCNGNGQLDACEITANAGLDKNHNGRLDSCELARGDLNLDGIVNAADLAVLLAFWGVPQAPVGDLNGDGAIGGADLAIMLGNWGTVG